MSSQHWIKKTGDSRMKKVTIIFTTFLWAFGLIFSVPMFFTHGKEATPTKGNLVKTGTPISVLVPRSGPPPALGEGSDRWQTPTAEEVKFFLSGKDKKATQLLKFQKFRKLLIAEGVPFEPNILLESNWQELLSKASPNFVSTRSSMRVANAKMKGAVIADSLYLTDKTEFTGDTIILARRLVFEGKDVLIKGNHNIAIFQQEASILTEPIVGKSTQGVYEYSVDSPRFEQEFFSKNRILKRTEEILKPVNGKINIDVSARKGEKRENFIGGPCSNGVGNCRYKPAGRITVDASGRGSKEWRQDQIKIRSGELAALIDSSGSAGADGSYPVNAVGNNGVHGQDGISGGQDGSCIGGTNDFNGKAGEDGSEGGDGEDGDDAGDDAVEGGTGNDITYSINGSESDFEFITRGGTGGSGRDGAIGGTGGNGGIGKKGGNGVTCGCFVGSGGKSGNNKKGGDAGSGGKGGNAARGGTGGSINITYPVGFNPASIITRNDGGDPGTPGRRGPAGQPGIGTPGQNGGNAGPSGCGVFGSAGGFGTSGSNGGSTNAALGGNTATQGDAGPAPVIQQASGGSGGGGGTFCELYPSSCGGSPCTPWYYVHYLSYDGGLTWEYQYADYIGCL
jgi:hypothetical protein